MGLLCLAQVVCELLEWRLGHLLIWPEVGGQICEGARDSRKCSLGYITGRKMEEAKSGGKKWEGEKKWEEGKIGGSEILNCIYI